MAREKPKIDPRKFSDLLALLKQRLPHYTPEWPGADDQDSGVALLKLFSHLTESVIKRLNQTPHQNLVAFLSMLGIKLLPAEPSRVPVRFKLVAGTSNEVLVPQRTQTTSAATDTRPELPFETEEDLLATPSPLVSVFSIDPEKDAIYQPPLGFLEREMPYTSAVAYALISFSRAGSSTLQLDHTDNLAPGDLLKLTGVAAASSIASQACVCPPLTEESETTAATVAEYVPIAEIKGTIVVLSTKLMHDYAPGTPVEKITKFHVFESRNLQEHILYLGHKDLFNVKSPVLFTLNITLMAGTEQGLEPLQVAWEYWGEIKGQEGTDWQAFTVQLDGSDGLSQNGKIELLKATEGEIKEFEVNGIKNRWMRAKLQEPLPANATRRLPVLDNTSFRVESAGATLPPDQAFHNDTPLDVNLPFYPFGLEPRLFDRFQMASKEVFSKKGAKVEIDIRADSLAILAAPAAVVVGNTRRIFARGTGGRLLEFRVEGGSQTATLEDHGLPSDGAIALPDPALGTEARPSIVHVLVPAGDIKVSLTFLYVRTENGNLAERFFQNGQERWIALNTPANGFKIKFDPAAVQTDDTTISVFVVADDGNLYELNRDFTDLQIDPPPVWENRARPAGQELNSSPHALVCMLDDQSRFTKVYVAGRDGQLYEWDGVVWKSHAALPAPLRSTGRPFAQLHCERIPADSKVQSIQLDDSASSQSDAYAGVEIEIQAPTGSPVIQSTAITQYDGRTKTATVEGRYWIARPGQNTKYEMKTAHRGVARFSGAALQLPSWAAKDDNVYAGLRIKVTFPAEDPDQDVIMEAGIAHYEGQSRTVTLDTGWLHTPDSKTKYEIDLPGQQGKAMQVGAGFVVLAPGALTRESVYVGLPITLIDSNNVSSGPFTIERYEGISRKAYLKEAWEPGTLLEYSYEISPWSGTLPPGANLTRVFLALSAAENNGIYEGLTIDVTSGPGVNQTAKILAYNGSTKIAEVDLAWKVPLTDTSSYEIGNLGGTPRGGTGLEAFERIWIKDSAGELRELDTRLPEWKNLGKPSDEIKVDSSPHGVVENMGTPEEEMHIFVRGSDQRLWKIENSGQWILDPYPGEIELRHSPFVLSITTPQHLVIYSSTNKNSILERRFSPQPALRGTAQVGTDRSVTLADSASGVAFDFQTDYIKLKTGPLSGTQRKLLSFNRNYLIAHIDDDWDTSTDIPADKRLPDSSTEYAIGREGEPAEAQGGSLPTVTLGAKASRVDDAYNDFDISVYNRRDVQLLRNRVISYQGRELQTATVEKAWRNEDGENVLDQISGYKIELDHTGTPGELTQASIRLGAEASMNRHTYDGMKIVVKHDGSDLPPVGNKVLEYFGGEEKRAWVSRSWGPERLPRAGDEYEIKSDEANVEKAAFASLTLHEGSTVEGAYDGLEITVTSPQEEAYTRKIGSYDGQVAILANEVWPDDFIPDSTFTYQFDGIVHSSNPDRLGDSKLIYLDFDHPQLAKHAGAYDGFQIIVTEPAPGTAARTRRAARAAARQQPRQIEAYYYDAVQRIAWAVVSEAWEEGKIPTPDYKYELVAVPRSVADAAMSTITLNQDADHAQNPLQGMSITVKRLADNEELPTNEIIAYDPATRVAKLKWPWSPDEVPDDNYNYMLHASGTVAEVAQPAELASIALEPAKATGRPGAYDDVPITLQIGDPPVRNGDSEQHNRIVSYEGGTDRRAYVRDSWNPDLLHLTSEHLYKLEAEIQNVRGVTHATITLTQAASGENNTYVGYGIIVRSQRRNIIAYLGNDRLASVDFAWELNAIPQAGDEYRLIDYKNPVHSGRAQVGTRNTITLDRNASADIYEFADRTLRITAGPGLPSTHVIDDYLGSDRVAILREDWTERPTTDSHYELEPIDVWQIHEDANALPITPQLSWEYWNSRGWVAFLEDLHQFEDGTKNLLIDGKVIFLLPQDLDLTEVSGQESYWIRARIIGGDYGRETYVLEERVKGANSEPQDIIKETKLLPVKSTIRPPQIFGLTISYKLEESRFPDRCLTYNNLDYVDQTDACITTDKRFSPFVPLEGQTAEEDDCGTVLKTAAGARAQVIPPTQLGKAIYLGFLNPLRSGPLKIFFAAKELPYSDATKPKMEWSYRAENEWQRLSFGDASEGLIKQEILQFIAPRDFTAATRFGSFRYWMRGMLLQGEYVETPVLGGIYPNTTWAFQAETRRDEILGSSSGEAGQAFRFFRFPVRAGQIVRVREVLTEEEKEELIKLFGEQALHEVKDELGKVLETWVLWTEVDNFFDSKGTDRHYTLDRATGELRFGDGRNGQIPPAGLNNLRAFSYQAGGGAVGNVEAGTIQSLTTAIANVEAVINPVEAGGGSDTASLDDMLVIGPAMINHRQRAVTPQDFEWLAKQASRQVAKARCVRNLDSQGRRATGWVTLYLVPHSRDSEPQPSLEMRRMVQRYVAEHCANTVAAPQHVFVAGPVYAEIDVQADLVVATIAAAARVEQEARAKLADFLHPLTGGPTDAGWEFGQGLSASDVYVLLEKIEGLDHVENLSFSRAGLAYTDLVAIGANELVAGGTLRINVTAKTGA
ncbi:putative baseplate assembly protein [bacterium]|nr:putative baseplate assembly protein [bacterium]